MRTRQAAAFVVIVAVVLAACSSGAGPGWTFAPTPRATAAAGGASSAAPSVGASAAPAGSPAASPAASGAAGGTVIEITASGIAFDKTELTAPAGVAFQIRFINNDAGIPHNVAIHKGSPTGEIVWQGEVFNGPETRTYDVTALPAGPYGFSCIVHPNMTGTLTVQ